MPIIAKASGDSSSFTPAPEGVHQAVCVDVIDKGMVKSSFLDKAGNPKMQHKIAVAWQIDELRDDGKRFVIYKRYTLSLNEKATLRKDLESWRGRAFTRDEEMGFDVETVKGANCLLNLQHHVVGDKTYANVMSVMPLMRNMAKIAPLNYERAVEGQANGEAEQQHTDSMDSSEFPPVTEELTDEDVPFDLSVMSIHRQVSAIHHPRASSSGCVYEHVLIAERALGRYMPDGAEIHHVDNDPRNNANNNLVICQDKAFHKLLHARTRVVKAGGDPDTQRICSFCRELLLFSAFNRRTSNVGTGIQNACRICMENARKARKARARVAA